MKRALLLLLLSALPSFATAAVTITFDAQKVRISGVSPRGQVVLMAIAVSRQGDYVSRVNRIHEVLSDTTGDGTAVFDFGAAIPFKSIWSAVDLQTGGYVVQTAPGYPLRPSQVPFDIAKNSRVEDLDELALDRLVIDVLWVRPDAKHGEAWYRSAGDGSESDDDHESNGHIHLRTDAFTPIAAFGKPPAKFKTDDVVIMLDHFNMEFAATTVVKR